MFCTDCSVVSNGGVDDDVDVGGNNDAHSDDAVTWQAKKMMMRLVMVVWILTVRWMVIMMWMVMTAE